MVLLLLLLTGSLAAMDEKTPVLPGNFDHEHDIDSEEISDLALSIYFDQDDPEMFQTVFPKVKAKLKQINEMPEAMLRAISRDFAKIKKNSSHHRHSHLVEHYPYLGMYLSRIMYKSIHEALIEERNYSNEIQRQKNCYKIAAIAGALSAAALTAAGTLIAHFVQPDCPTTN